MRKAEGRKFDISCKAANCLFHASHGSVVVTATSFLKPNPFSFIEDHDVSEDETNDEEVTQFCSENAHSAIDT